MSSLVALQAQGASYPGDHNLREACRKQVAGQYLELYDQREKSRAMALYLQRKVKDLQKELTACRNQLRKIKDEIAAESFDVNKIAQQNSLQEKEKTLQDNLHSQAQLLERVQGDAVKADGQLSDYDKRLAKVFKIESLPGQGVGYKFKIEYRSPCPPFRFSCPLPRDDAEALQRMFTPAAAPVACQKYADFLRW